MADPIFLAEATTIPWPIATAIVAPLGTTVAVLWRRCVVLEERSRTDMREVLPVMKDAVEAMKVLAENVEDLAEKIDVPRTAA